MSEVIEEIENAIDLFKLNLSVKRVTAGLEEVLFKELLDCFVEGGDRRWWWESFKNCLNQSFSKMVWAFKS